MDLLVLADTHLDARRADTLVDVLGERLETADVILHAGDVTDAAVLGRLAEFAPVHAVDGNNDHGLDRTERLEIELDGIRIAMVHDSGSSTGRGRRLATWFPAADVVVFGHSHLPWNETVEVDGGVQHHFNPGSPTQRRRAAPGRSAGSGAPTTARSCAPTTTWSWTESRRVLGVRTPSRRFKFRR